MKLVPFHSRPFLSQRGFALTGTISQVATSTQAIIPHKTYPS